jgi:LPXTG-motif cell wall-anchored protein
MNRVLLGMGTAATLLWGRLLAALLLASVLIFGAVPASTASAQAQRDIVDTAVAAGQFTTLAAALQAAGLVDTLKGPGPFTVFAPTDAAFAKLPPGTVEGLLADPARLRAVLTYHVVPGRVTAAQVVGLTTATTVQGEPLRISATGGTVRINSATVTQADIMASNGVIHVVDTVLLPPSLPQTGGADGVALPVMGAIAALLLGGVALRVWRRPQPALAGRV